MRGRAWAALALAAAVGWSAWPLPRALATHVVDPVRLSPAGLWGRVDLDLLLWILAWDAHALATAPAALFQGNILYPAPDALASSEHLLGLAPVAAPVFLASGNAVLTYNVTVLITVLVTAVVTFALVRHWTGDGPAAFLAAAAFTFSPMNIHGWARLHATAVHLFPLVLLLAWRAAGAPRPRTLALLALAVALQCLAGMYVSYELLALVAAMAPALWWEALRHRRSGLAVAAALAAGALVLVPVGIPYLRARSAGILPEYGAVLAEGLAPTLARLGDALTWPVVALGLLGACRGTCARVSAWSPSSASRWRSGRRRRSCPARTSPGSTRSRRASSPASLACAPRSVSSCCRSSRSRCSRAWALRQSPEGVAGHASSPWPRRPW